MLRLSCLFLISATAASAQSAVTADSFEAHVTGKTLEFATNGTVFGVEEYFPNRRVRWSFLDGTCQDGEWYPDDDLICFAYDDLPGPQCWTFFLDNGRLSARFASEPPDPQIYATRERSAPLQCLGPEVGA